MVLQAFLKQIVICNWGLLTGVGTVWPKCLKQIVNCNLGLLTGVRPLWPKFKKKIDLYDLYIFIILQVPTNKKSNVLEIFWWGPHKPFLCNISVDKSDFYDMRQTTPQPNVLTISWAQIDTKWQHTLTMKSVKSFSNTLLG